MRILRFALACLVPTASVACLASSGGDGSSSEPVGEATAAITRVPTGVQCIDITTAQAADDRVIDQKFTVTPGQGAVLTLKGLPLGPVTFSGLAYSVACTAVTSTTVATWATDPVAATLSPGVATNAVLDFHAPGSATIGVDFDDAGAWPITLSTPSVTFPTGPCSATPATQTVSVTNVSSASVTVTGAISPTSPIAVAPASLTLAAGQTAAMQLISTATAPLTFNGSLTLTTNVAGDVPHVVPVSEQINGGVLAFHAATGALQPTLAFGKVNQPDTATTTLYNTGNAASNVSVVVTPSTSNTDYPSTAMFLIDGVAARTWTTVANVGASTVVYGYNHSAPCNHVYTYTVTIPSEANGVCTGVTQTVTFTAGDTC